MKWFKHLSGALNDNLIFDAVEKFGGDGYMVFFGTLEILADEFDIYNPGSCRLSIKKLTKSFQISRQKLTKILTYFDQKANEIQTKDKSFFVCFQKDHVIIKCNRLAELCDEHTQKLLKKNRESIGSQSGVSRDVEAEAEADKDKDIIANTVVNDLKPGGNGGEEKQAFYKNLKDALTRIQDKNPDPYFNQQVLIFLQSNTKANPNAIIHCLKSILKAPGEIKNPKAYLTAALKIEEGKYNARESERISSEHKMAPITLGAMIDGIGKRI